MAELLGLIQQHPKALSDPDPAANLARHLGISRVAKSTRTRLEEGFLDIGGFAGGRGIGEGGGLMREILRRIFWVWFGDSWRASLATTTHFSVKLSRDGISPRRVKSESA